MKRAQDRYRSREKKVFKVAHFYCDICGYRNTITRECSRCVVNRIISKFDDLPEDLPEDHTGYTYQ